MVSFWPSRALLEWFSEILEQIIMTIKASKDIYSIGLHHSRAIYIAFANNRFFTNNVVNFPRQSRFLPRQADCRKWIIRHKPSWKLSNSLPSHHTFCSDCMIHLHTSGWKFHQVSWQFTSNTQSGWILAFSITFGIIFGNENEIIKYLQQKSQTSKNK